MNIKAEHKNFSAPTKSELVDKAKSLQPLIRKQAEDAEDQRQLPKETIKLLTDSGLHKVYMPSKFGGWEMDWGAHFDISREISKACGSSGWITGLVFSHVIWVARFTEKAQEEFFDRNPDPIISTGSAGGGKLKKDGDKYILNGRWAFLSGVDHANGAMVVATHGDEKIFTHFVLLNPEDWKNEKNWVSEGLKGTGSHNITVSDVKIPAHRVIERDVMLDRDPPGAKVHDSYIYKIRTNAYQKSWFTGILLGTAMGAIEEYSLSTSKRRGALFGESIVDQVPVQVRLGESVAEVNAAGLIFDALSNMLHRRGVNGQDIIGNDLLSTKRDITYASRLCVKASERLSGMMGVSAQTGRNPVQRHYRDCRTVSTHIELQWDHSMSPTGKHLLGLDTGDPLIDNNGIDKGATDSSLYLGTRV